MNGCDKERLPRFTVCLLAQQYFQYSCLNMKCLQKVKVYGLIKVFFGLDSLFHGGTVCRIIFHRFRQIRTFLSFFEFIYLFILRPFFWFHKFVGVIIHSVPLFWHIDHKLGALSKKKKKMSSR